jgi:hypothetical protein
MPDNKGNLYLFEAIELRSEYDRRINLVQSILNEEGRPREGFFRASDDEEKVESSDFDKEAVENNLKSFQTKRVKLNQAIQASNFNHYVKFEGEEISIAEALEVRKNLLKDLEVLSKRVTDSAYKRIIHKEERDIIREPSHKFSESYERYENKVRMFRELVTSIHVANHKNVVKFKDEA